MEISNKDITLLTNYIEQLTYLLKTMEKSCLDTLACEISLPELQVIVYLGQTGLSRMSDIAAHMFTSLSNLTVIVAKLVKKDLAKRRRSQEDRRVVMVELTRQGNKHYISHRSVKLQLCRQILGALDESDRNVYLELIRKIARNIK